MDNNPTTNNPAPTATPKPEQKKGLGRGLAALLGGDEDSPFSRPSSLSQTAKPVEAVVVATAPVAEVAAEPVKQLDKPLEPEELNSSAYRVLSLPVDKVKPNEDQPRQHFSDARLQELAESICEQGLIQPIVVRMMPDQSYQIVAGERRWRACKMLGMAEVPAIVRDQNEQAEKAELASVIENIQRVELNPVELADAYSKILKNHSFTQEELAKKLGVSRVSVANTLRLQKLPTMVKDSIVQGKLSEGHARALLTLEKEEDIKALAQEVIDQGLTVREVEARVRAKTQGSAVVAIPSTTSATNTQVTLPTNVEKNPELMAAEEELRGIFGTKATVRGNAKGGVIELFYSNEDSLHRLLHQLRSARSG